MRSKTIVCVSILCAALTGVCLVMAQDNKERIETMFKEVQKLLDAGDVDGGVKILKKIVKEDPANWDAYNTLGNLSLAREEYSKADSYYNKAIEIDPARAEGFNNLGVLELKRGNGEAALKHFSTAAGLDPKHVGALNNIGNIMLGLGQIDKAAEYFLKALNADPGHFMARYRMANIMAAKGVLGEAEQMLAMVVKQKPAFIEGRIDYASVLLRQGKKNEAEEQFREAAKVDPRNIRAQCTLGVFLREDGRMDEALRVIEAAMAQAPDDPLCLVEHSMTLFKAKGADALDTCEKQMKKAVKKDSANPRPLYLLAMMYDDAGKPDKAISYYKKAMDEKYEVNMCKLYIAENYVKMGKKGDAVPIVKELLSTLPEGNKIRNAAIKIQNVINAK